jgi:hypothetical protein
MPGGERHYSRPNDTADYGWSTSASGTELSGATSPLEGLLSKANLTEREHNDDRCL